MRLLIVISQNIFPVLSEAEVIDYRLIGGKKLLSLTMASFGTKQGRAAYEQLTEDHDLDQNLESLGIPILPRSYSWKEALAIICCAVSLAVSIIVVFVPRLAVYLGQTGQFICVGLCLTLMGWCTQLPLRRILLISSTNSQASTLQSMDAILRSDPLTSQAHLRVRLFLVIMLALGPALSAAYKSLGGGESRYLQNDMMGQFGLTDPLGTRSYIGNGVSQFVNATLPWFRDPGLSNRVYGFNMHVATENMSAMLDGPTADYIHSLRESLMPLQSKIVTAIVPAIVCKYNPQLDHSVEYFQSLWGQHAPNTTSSETWTVLDRYRLGMLMPVMSDNRNHVIANWDTGLNESFGSHLWQYSLSRQNYTGSWRVSRTSVELVNAIPSDQLIDDHCLLRSSFSDLPDLFIKMLAEYDWRYHAKDLDFYQKYIKNDATLVASMVWSRIAALTPEALRGVIEGSIKPQCDPEDPHELFYNTSVIVETVTVAIKPGWGIILILALYPILLFTSLVVRVILWPHSPIGEGFGLISLLASAGLALLDGAGLSGKLSRPVFVGMSVSRRNNEKDDTGAGKITSFFKTEKLESGGLNKGTKYH